MPNKEEGEMGKKRLCIKKNKREMSNINGSLLKMTRSHLCHFYSILYLEQHGLKLKLKLQHCGQSEQKSTVLCVVNVKHY